MGGVTVKSVLAAVLLVLGTGVAVACDDHVGTCKLEAWRALPLVGDYLTIDGSATCDKGFLKIRLYDGKTFIGTADGLIEGHVAEAIATGISANPKDLVIKYSIRPR